jgi:predicted metal-binding membrane protein
MTRTATTIAWHPEWPVAALIGFGWLISVALQASGDHRLHTAPAWIAWSIMSALMMLPVTLPAIRHLAFNSFRRRRLRAMIVFVTAYLTGWIGFGLLALEAVSVTLRAGVRLRDLTIATLVVAALWQLAPYRRRAILRCRQAVPLSPRGLRADSTCAHFGMQQALHCMRVCWPAMFLMAIIGHQLAPMAALTIVIVAEEHAPWRERLFAPVFALFLVAAGMTAALGV